MEVEEEVLVVEEEELVALVEEEAAALEELEASVSYGAVYTKFVQLLPLSHFWYRESASAPPQYSLLLPLQVEKQLPRTPVVGAPSAGRVLPQ